MLIGNFYFQLLQESIGIPGSNLNLIYRSSWATGYYSYLIIHLTQSDISPELKVVHISVEIEGSIYNHVLEADPNLKYTFTWDKRNVYKQKVSFPSYGVPTFILSRKTVSITRDSSYLMSIVKCACRFMESQKLKCQSATSTRLVTR